MEKITNIDIAKYLNKQVSTVNGWSSRNPELLELVKLGAFCKKNELDMEKIRALVTVQDMIGGKGFYE